MDRRVRVWATGTLAVLFGIASTVLNVIFALNIKDDGSTLTTLQIFLWVAFGLSFVGLASVTLLSIYHARNLTYHIIGSRRRTWSLFVGGVVAAAVSLAVSGVALVWLVIRRLDLPDEILHTAPMTLVGIWFAAWGVSILLQVVLYCDLGLWTTELLKSQRASMLDLDFGISRAPSMATIQHRPDTQHTNASFGSQEPTLHSPPRTPVSRGGESSTTRGSSATRVGGPGSSKTKLVRYSNRSSFECMPFPAGEAMSIDSAFDNWDTSSVHHEMRAVIRSSPPPVAVRSGGLEPIPGSRPDSPATALDGPFLPESPIEMSSSPHATTSDTATTVGWGSSPRPIRSSPPSSPVNFSRPTSRPGSSHNNKSPAPPKPAEKFETTSMQDLIHPLFRPNSPHPPPIATMGTMVTASPMADQMITPRTLAKLRSNSPPATTSAPLQPPPVFGKPRAPSVDQSDTQSVEMSIPDSPTLGSAASIGSPGPSIVDDSETDLPPILPGFVLSAGSRSSLVGYGKRKSIKKDRPKSTLSTGSRLSQVMM